jgi:hypothetical protein
MFERPPWPFYRPVEANIEIAMMLIDADICSDRIERGMRGQSLNTSHCVCLALILHTARVPEYAAAGLTIGPGGGR